VLVDLQPRVAQRAGGLRDAVAQLLAVGEQEAMDADDVDAGVEHQGDVPSGVRDQPRPIAGPVDADDDAVATRVLDGPAAAREELIQQRPGRRQRAGGELLQERQEARAPVRARRQGDVELDLATLGAAGGRAQPLEDAHGVHVAGQDRRDEALDALLPRAGHQGVEQRRRHAAALPVVDDDDRGLGLTRAGADEARDADALAGVGVQGHERLVVAVVDAGEVLQVAPAQPRDRREEPPEARLGAEALEPLGERVAILGLDGADRDLRSVPELHALHGAPVRMPPTRAPRSPA
jgi:hypothetical protein